MSKKTHTNPLSKQEIEKLRKNPYVASVTTNTVRFTEAFKEQAYEKKRQGIPVMETMRQCGIDPEILGASRVEGFSYTLNKKAKQESGFSDRRSENYRRPPKTGEETVEQRIRQLENELAYTRQEVEFLKNCRRQIWRLRNNGNPSTGRSKVRPHLRGCTARRQSVEHQCSVSDCRRIPIRILRLAGCRAVAAKP